MRKTLIFALVLIALTLQLNACSENTSIEQLNDDSPTASDTDEPQGGTSSTTLEASDTSEIQTETSFENNSQTESTPVEETHKDDTPKWTETAVSGECYVNTDYINSRVNAIQGSDTVRQYRLNDKVTVVAKTNTNYYKLNDGTFIHCDYLSESYTASTTNEPQTETPSEDNLQTQPMPIEETHKDDTPKWTETAVSGELYVNTDYISSRVNAIQGSNKVKQYMLNDKVTVVAKTDTNYYKLNDGTFIHCDYLSESEIKDSSNSVDYTSQTKNGYTIERISGITYVDGIMIASKTYTLPRSYDPGTKKEAADALAEMQAAAAADGLSLYVISGYRSYYVQEAVYADWVNRDGTEKADTYSSRPGHSDHQTGYTFDLNSLDQSFAYTPEGKWLAEHCADYGFIIRYPEGKEKYTGYIYEPWHVRYIGKEKAKAVTESGLSLEEYYGITSDYADCEEE